MDLTERVLEGELMDAPDLEAAPHRAALSALGRINLLSGTASVISRAIIEHSAMQRADRRSQASLRILDLACGGGDVTLAVAEKLATAGVRATIEGWDRSPTAVEFAAQRSHLGDVDVQFIERDALALNVEQNFDVVMCTLFLHHLDRAAAIELLSKMYRAASRLVLIDDLRRTRAGYCLAQLACHALSRSRIVHVDGPLSVRAAFTEAELLALSHEAKLPPPVFVRHWPQRFLMRWNRSP
ncbi:MAG: methyltransferase domain-containing protein [Aureliella sp.]